MRTYTEREVRQGLDRIRALWVAHEAQVRQAAALEREAELSLIRAQLEERCRAVIAWRTLAGWGWFGAVVFYIVAMGCSG